MREPDLFGARGRSGLLSGEEVKVALLLVATLAVLGHWFGMARRAFAIAEPFSVGASTLHEGHRTATVGRHWITHRLPSGRLRMAAALAVLGWAGAVGFGVQSQIGAPPAQTIAPPGSAADAAFYLKRGEDFSSVHEYDRAIADYTTAIQLKPDYAEAYNDRGFAYYLKGNPERAIADYTRAIELRPNYPKAYNSRGVVYMAFGYGSAKAVADFDRAIALKPTFRYAYINRANARGLRHPWLALEDFHRADMYPERRLAVLGGAILALVVGMTLIRRTRIHRAG